MLKVLTTGNPSYGLASGISSIIGSDFCSRTNGFDISTDLGMDAFCNESEGYDVVILNCYTEKMNNYSQARLLHKIYVEWCKMKKHGHIIAIGSISDHINTSQPWLKYISYSSEKIALKNLCQIINHNRKDVSPTIKCTYVCLGHMHTPYVDKLHPNEEKLDVKYVARMVKWLIDEPECIEEITLTKHVSNG